MTYPVKRPLADKYLYTSIPDISTASSHGALVVPAQGLFIGYRIVRSATTTGDAGISVELNGTAIDTAAAEFEAGALADVLSVDCAPTAVKDGDVLDFISDGDSTTASVGHVTAIIREL